MESKEYEYKGLLINGFAMIFFTFILLPVIIIGSLVLWAEDEPGLCALICVPAFILFIVGCVGYFVQQPNESRVMIFFGKYVGTCKRVGYFWTNPFVTRRKISLRIRNMDIEPIKVNDKVGNPVMIGMVLVWRVKDTYKVVFDLDTEKMDLDKFVRIQSDAALREVTGQYAYDGTNDEPDALTLRDGGDEINELLERKINERLAMAGIEVVEARLNYLAYAPEIAAVMLRRQQAAAIITAREKIVEGAVSMVRMALQEIEDGKIVTLTSEQKADMVSRLLVVLCSDESAQPVIPT